MALRAEILDIHTRAKGVSMATMISFAFNTMIGQVTSIAITNIGYRFHFVFVVCNSANALFFLGLLAGDTQDPVRGNVRAVDERAALHAGQEQERSRRGEHCGREGDCGSSYGRYYDGSQKALG
ncbi:MAG: hypothetical protein LQ340_004560 [Diploschistes diacapsis]|nr:MAG: hypothetical protein LQ340_004560 [Diploschistes diacapsis]